MDACARCGSERKPGVAFCTTCGERFAESPPPGPAAGEAAAVAGSNGEKKARILLQERRAEPGAQHAADVFVSHVEEDATVALQIADGLGAAGYSTWCYERDSVPGPSYLLQTSTAIERSRAVVVLISPHSLGSNQVTKEVVRAHEAVKPFIPLLISISHVEFANRQPEWREAIGSATTIAVPKSGAAEVVPRIVDGLKALGIEPSGDGSVPRRTVVPFPVPGAGRARSRWTRVSGRKLFAAALAVALVAGGTAFLALRGGEERRGIDGAVTPTTDGTPAPTTDGTTAPGPGEVLNAATTPVETSQGEARVASARLLSQECPPAGLPGECQTAAGDSRFVVLDFYAWDKGDLVFNEALSMEAFGAYVSFEGRRASVVRTWLLEGFPKGFRVTFASLPASAAGKDANLFWPDNPPLRVRLRA